MTSVGAGTRFGPYEVLEPLGVGGMGEVYRARDIRLGRDVAVKILPPDFSDNPANLQRFEMEARATSSLNHPNLVTVHDFGVEGGVTYIIFELLEGRTLHDALQNGPLSLRRALEYATQMARGLAAAHEKRIIHRDIKPENIFVTLDDRVKILDFGIARHDSKVLPSDDADTPTLATPTSPGSMIGSIGYMSPEQVRGEPVDHRADIFSFGVVLYEMISGQRAFRGKSVYEVMNAIVRDQPPDLPSVSSTVDRIIRHCLEKRPEARFQSASDLALALEAVTTNSSAPDLVMTEPLRPSFRISRKRAMRWVLVLAAIPAALVAGAMLSHLYRDPSPRFQQLTFRRGDISNARFTPDGTSVVYSASWNGEPYQIYTSRAGNPESRGLGVESHTLLAVSGKGDIALLVGGRHGIGTAAITSLSGEAPREIMDGVQLADFLPDGSALAVVRRAGSEYRIELPPGKTIYRSTTYIRDLRISPDGQRIAFRRRSARLSKSYAVVTISIHGGDEKNWGEWLESRGLAWRDGGELWFMSSEAGGGSTLNALSRRGSHRVVWRSDGRVRLLDIGKDGRLLFSRDDYRGGISAHARGEKGERDLSWFDGSGPSDISGDGKLLLMTEFSEAVGSDYTSYVRPMDGGPAVRIGTGYSAAFSPDAANVLVLAAGPPSRLLILPVGAGSERALPRGTIDDYEYAAWSPDGKQLAVTAREKGKALQVFTQRADGQDSPKPLTPPGFAQTLPSRSISPDGTQLALLNRTTGQIVLIPVHGGPLTPVPVNKKGLIPICWSRDGQSLYAYGDSPPPVNLYTIAISTGVTSKFTTLMPSDPAGVYAIQDIVVGPDNESYAYGYVRNLASLQLVTGLR